MVKAFELIVIAGIGLVAFFLINQSKKPLQLENFIIPNPTPSTTIGLPEGAVTGGGQSAGQIKENIITSNLVSQESLSNLFNNRIGAQSLDIFEDENFKLEITNAFKPIGSAQVLNPVTGKPVIQNFIGRTEPSFRIEGIDKRTGEVKVRFGSKALVERLQQNYANSSITQVS